MLPLDATLLAPQDLSHSHSLPAACYVDPAFATLDRRAVFARSWQLAGHVSRLAQPGDFLAESIAGLPVLLLRADDGRLRAFHNVCRHRGGPLARGHGCGLKRLRCLYHGWTYGLDGALKSAPEMGGVDDFIVGDVRLPELAVREWQGMIFVCEDEAGAPRFEDVVAGIDARLGERRLADYRFHRRETYEIACNWKLYVDNYLEGYHVPHIHPGLNKLLDYRSYTTTLAAWYSLQYSPLESSDALYGNGDALYYFLYPNTMLNSLPGRLQTNRVLPIGIDRCRVEFDFYYPDDDSAEAAARRERDREFSDEVQTEDVGICEEVQLGLASGSYVPGRLNPLRESGVHHFHELIRRVYREAGNAG